MKDSFQLSTFNSQLSKGWEYGTLEDAVNKGSSNISLNKIKNDDGDYPVFSAKGFAKNVSFFQQEQEYLAIIKDGAGIGRVAKYPAKSSVVATMQYLIPKDGFDIGFIEHFLTGIDFEKHRSGSTIPHVYFKDYKSEAFPLIPLPEQQRIVKILDKAFVAIDKAKQNAEQNLRNAKEVFENYLDDVFDNEDFEEIELGEITNFRNGMNYSKSSKGESIKIVGVRDFQNDYWVSFDRLEKVKIDNELREIDKLRKDDIITVRSNGNPELIGRTLLADNVSGNVSHSGFTIRIRTHSKNITPSYLCHYLKARKTRSKLTKSGKGINIKSLSQVALSKLSVKHPRLLIEQKHIVQKLSELSKKTKKLETLYQQKIAHTEELKKSILQKAFKGEL